MIIQETFMNPKKIAFIILGCICLALGTIGVIVPVLPTAPFYLVTVYCFARSSDKLHDWFCGTDLYKNHLDSFVRKEGMLQKTKISIIASVTLLMGFGFFMMARKGLWIPCGILAVVWLCHVIYFGFVVQTIPEK